MAAIVDNGGELARQLLVVTAPDEADFFEEYRRGLDLKASGRLGPEFGVFEAASLGPTAVAVGFFLFDVLKSWLAEVPKKIVEGYVVDRGKDQLKEWLGSPGKGSLAGVVTDKGKVEILAIVSGLTVKAKLSPRDAERLTRKVAEQLFGSDDAAPR